MDDERLVSKIAHPDLRLRGERIVGRQCDDKAVVPQPGDDEFGIGDRRSQQRDVDLTGCQRAHLRGHEHLAAEGEVDARQLDRQCARQGGQVTVGGRADTADGEVSDRTGSHPTGKVAGVVDPCEQFTCPVEVGAAGFGELDLARGAMQQLDTELGFELPNRLRERGLGHVQAGGGTSEVGLLGHRHEIAQLT